MKDFEELTLLPHQIAARSRLAGYREQRVGIDLPNTDDLIELAQAACPQLARKAIELAAESDSLPAVMSVLKEMMDRAYGKPVQAVTGAGGKDLIPQTITLRFVKPDERE